jgi:hypothetical protein
MSRGGTEIKPGKYRPQDYSLRTGLDYMCRYTAQVITSKYFAIRYFTIFNCCCYHQHTISNNVTGASTLTNSKKQSPS